MMEPSSLLLLLLLLSVRPVVVGFESAAFEICEPFPLEFEVASGHLRPAALLVQ